MSTKFITSDLHFGHANILNFCPATRPFRDVTHMDETMITEWNETVRPNDITYIVGDFSFHEASRAAAIAKRLNGHKILIEGNHDRKILKSEHFRSCFQEIHKYYEMTHNGTLVVMFHYPIAEFNQMHRGAVHFHGHLHGKPSGVEQYRIRDVAYDATGKIVTRLDDFIKDAMKGAIKSHHQNSKIKEEDE